MQRPLSAALLAQRLLRACLALAVRLSRACFTQRLPRACSATALRNGYFMLLCAYFALAPRLLGSHLALTWRLKFYKPYQYRTTFCHTLQTIQCAAKLLPLFLEYNGVPPRFQ